MLNRILLAIFIVGAFPQQSDAEPIHEAAVKGDVESVRRLLSEGTPVDQFDTTDAYGRETTALYKATMAGRTEVVEFLLKVGADPTLRARKRESILNPLQVAAKFGRADILRMFLEHGADPNAAGRDSTALHVATTSRKSEIVQMLLDAGALMRVEQPPIASRLSEANVDQGRQIFVENCRRCHGEPRPSDETGAKDRIANLWDIVGREIASQDKTIYSDAMKAVGGAWTYDRLNSFIALPGGFVPGTMMESPDLVPPEEAGRIDLVAYLRTQSDNPLPLPD